MRRVAILAAALATALPAAAHAVDFAWPVVRVIDGGTIVVGNGGEKLVNGCGGIVSLRAEQHSVT